MQRSGPKLSATEYVACCNAIAISGRDRDPLGSAFRPRARGAGGERIECDSLASVFQDGRHVTPKRQGGDRRSGRIEAHAALILRALERRPDVTLADLRAELAGRGIGVSVAGLWRFFKRGADDAHKKAGHAAEQDRPDVLSRREAWFEGQLDLDQHTLVFIDETGASTKMARLHGRAPRGERLRTAILHGANCFAATVYDAY